MSQSFLIELERRTGRGWTRVHWDLPPADHDDQDPRFNPGEFYDRIFFYVLSAVEYRVNPDHCPEPLVVRPRGVPPDLSPGLVEVREDDVYLLHWLYPSEVLLYDWGAYERFLTERNRQFEQRYEEEHGHPFARRHPESEPYTQVEFLDMVAALDPIEDYRLIFGKM